jgi:hypothetical protein
VVWVDPYYLDARQPGTAAIAEAMGAAKFMNSSRDLEIEPNVMFKSWGVTDGGKSLGLQLILVGDAKKGQELFADYEVMQPSELRDVKKAASRPVPPQSGPVAYPLQGEVFTDHDAIDTIVENAACTPEEVTQQFRTVVADESPEEKAARLSWGTPLASVGGTVLPMEIHAQPDDVAACLSSDDLRFANMKCPGRFIDIIATGIRVHEFARQAQQKQRVTRTSHRRVDALTLTETDLIMNMSKQPSEEAKRFGSRYKDSLGEPQFVLAPTCQGGHFFLFQIVPDKPGKTADVYVLDSIRQRWSDYSSGRARMTAHAFASVLFPWVVASRIRLHLHIMPDALKQTDTYSCGFYVAASMLYLGAMKRPSDLGDFTHLAFSKAHVPMFKKYLAVILASFTTFCSGLPKKVRNGIVGWEHFLAHHVAHGDFHIFHTHPLFFETSCLHETLFELLGHSSSQFRIVFHPGTTGGRGSLQQQQQQQQQHRHEAPPPHLPFLDGASWAARLFPPGGAFRPTVLCGIAN